MDMLILLAPYLVGLGIAVGTVALVRFVHADLETPFTLVAPSVVRRALQVQAPLILALTFPACLAVAWLVGAQATPPVPLFVAVGEVALLAAVIVDVLWSRAARWRRSAGIEHHSSTTFRPREGMLRGERVEATWDAVNTRLRLVAGIGTIAALPLSVGLARLSLSLPRFAMDEFELVLASVVFVGPSLVGAAVLVTAAFTPVVDRAPSPRVKGVLLATATALLCVPLLWLFGWQLRGAT